MRYRIRWWIVATAVVLPWIIPIEAVARTFGPSAFGSPLVFNDAFGNDRRPRVAADGVGNWVAVWESRTSLGGGRVGSDVLFTRSTDGGATWSTPAALNRRVDDWPGNHRPDVASDGAGNWLVAWASSDAPATGSLDIVVSRSTDGGATWSPPSAVSSGQRHDESPRISSDGAGWLLVWRSFGGFGRDPHISGSRSTDGGETWSPEATLIAHASNSPYDSLALASDTLGNWLALWESGDDLSFSRSTDGGVTWTTPRLFFEATSVYARAPHLVGDGVGNFVATWSHWGSLLVSRSADSGMSWSPAEVLRPNDARHWADEPLFVTTDHGGTWLVLVRYAGRLHVSRSTDRGETWSPLAEVEADTPPRGSQHQVATDGTGKWIMVSRSLKDGERGDADILLSRAPALCRRAPATTCEVGFAKGFFMAKETIPGREKLVAKFLKGPALDQADFGDPLAIGGTAFALCIYDEADTLVASLEVDRAGELCGPQAPCWRAAGKDPPDGKGYIYKDKHALSSGVSRLFLRGRKAGKSQALVHAKNHAKKGWTSLATGTAGALAGQTRASMQLVTSDAACLSLELTDIVRNEVGYFKAK